MYSLLASRCLPAAKQSLRHATSLKNAFAVPLASRYGAQIVMSNRNFSLTSINASVNKVETFLNGPSSQYIEDMYAAWLEDPKSVHVSWQIYFKNLLAGGKNAFVVPPTIVPPPSQITGGMSVMGPEVNEMAAAVPSTEVLEHMKVQLMVRAFQVSFKSIYLLHTAFQIISHIMSSFCFRFVVINSLKLILLESVKERIKTLLNSIISITGLQMLI